MRPEKTTSKPARQDGKRRVLFISNIPAPYRIDFFNALGRLCELTVVFEARRAAGVRFNWNEDTAKCFTAVFLSDGDIDETHINWRILKHIKPGRYDEIVATSYGYYTETAALLIMRLRGIAYDLELDGGVVRQGEQACKRLLKRWIIRGANRLFSTGGVTDALFLHYGADHARIVRYPFTSLHACEVLDAVPADTVRRAKKDALGVQSNHLLLTVGQFIHRKGFDVLLSHCDRLDPDTELVLIGGAPTSEYLGIVESKRLERVRFLPFLNQEALTEWFLAADVFVLPTREDMWGLVINEAMANALPVVTTDRCNAGVELVEPNEAGYLVPAEDGAALMDRVNALLTDDARRVRMAHNALRAMQRCTIEEMAAVHARIFGMAEP